MFLAGLVVGMLIMIVVALVYHLVKFDESELNWYMEGYRDCAEEHGLDIYDEDGEFIYEEA